MRATNRSTTIKTTWNPDGELKSAALVLGSDGKIISAPAAGDILYNKIISPHMVTASPDAVEATIHDRWSAQSLHLDLAGQTGTEFTGSIVGCVIWDPDEKLRTGTDLVNDIRSRAGSFTLKPWQIDQSGRFTWRIPYCADRRGWVTDPIRDDETTSDPRITSPGRLVIALFGSVAASTSLFSVRVGFGGLTFRERKQGALPTVCPPDEPPLFASTFGDIDVNIDADSTGDDWNLDLPLESSFGTLPLVDYLPGGTTGHIRQGISFEGATNSAYQVTLAIECKYLSSTPLRWTAAFGPAPGYDNTSDGIVSPVLGSMVTTGVDDTITATTTAIVYSASGHFKFVMDYRVIDPPATYTIDITYARLFITELDSAAPKSFSKKDLKIDTENEPDTVKSLSRQMKNMQRMLASITAAKRESKEEKMPPGERVFSLTSAGTGVKCAHGLLTTQPCPDCREWVALTKPPLERALLSPAPSATKLPTPKKP
jgi:hypothetical protein